MRLTRIRIAAALGLGLALAGCAPQRVSVPDLATAPRHSRYEAGLERRASRQSADAELSARATGSAIPDLPGVSARLVLVAPDAFRLRVGSMFGTAIDVSARGDSFMAYVPSRRAVLETAAARESLGLGDPGRLGFRAWAATWEPPPGAWIRATWEDSLLVLRWREEADSVRLAVGSHGLPHWVEMQRSDGPRVRAEYLAWTVFDGVMWPSQITIEDGEGSYGLRCRIQNVQFQRTRDRARLAVDVPSDAERVTREDLRRAIERLGKF